MELKMWAVTVSIKFQNKLAKESILSTLKSKSINMFEGGGLIFRCFVNITENSVEIYHVLRVKAMFQK